jgi:hypothetical protein
VRDELRGILWRYRVTCADNCRKYGDVTTVAWNDGLNSAELIRLDERGNLGREIGCNHIPMYRVMLYCGRYFHGFVHQLAVKSWYADCDEKFRIVQFGCGHRLTILQHNVRRVDYL